MQGNRRHIFSASLFQSSAPFSHVVIAGGPGYVSGIIGQRRDNGALVDPDVRLQTHAMFDNLATALHDAGFGLADLVATRLYMLDYAEFHAINTVYRERLAPPFPARTTLQVAALPLGARVQIDAVIDSSQ
jgi:2-iminobutanoate/2-iminopropanoate deaminase